MENILAALRRIDDGMRDLAGVLEKAGLSTGQQLEVMKWAIELKHDVMVALELTEAKVPRR